MIVGTVGDKLLSRRRCYCSEPTALPDVLPTTLTRFQPVLYSQPPTPPLYIVMIRSCSSQLYRRSHAAFIVPRNPAHDIFPARRSILKELRILVLAYFTRRLRGSSRTRPVLLAAYPYCPRPEIAQTLGRLLGRVVTPKKDGLVTEPSQSKPYSGTDTHRS